MSPPAYLATEDDPRVGELRTRLERFYASTTEYPDFRVESNSKPEFWAPVREEVRRLLVSRDRCRVLEFGAGRTAFGAFLGELRPRVRFEAQDITAQNREYLSTRADAVHIADLRTLAGPYDVILSTFVWEHLTSPRATLDALLRMLSPGGSLFIACPRYDMPGYVPPSARHYGVAGRLGVACRLATRRFFPASVSSFPIHLEPKVFFRPWTRDADAVHWVAMNDFFNLPQGYSCRRLRIPVRGVRARIWERFLLAFVQITRAETPA